MIAPFYHNPECVETIIQALARGIGPDKARAMLIEGVELNLIKRALFNIGAVDPYSILLAALKSGDFTTLPKIDPVHNVRERRGVDRWDFGGVNFFTDREIIVGDRVLLRLQPPSGDPKSALASFLVANRYATKKEALNAVRNEFPDVKPYAFERLWPYARKAAGLPSHGSPGRPRRKIGNQSAIILNRERLFLRAAACAHGRIKRHCVRRHDHRASEAKAANQGSAAPGRSAANSAAPSENW